MSFDPKTLPASVQAVYRQGPLAWALAVDSCLRVGIEDPIKLADIVFYLHHPERIGRPLQSYEVSLINQWKGFRTLIMPRLASFHQSFHIGHIEGTDVYGF
jgi:hypothetical protein